MKQAQEPIIYGIDARDVQRFMEVAPFDLVSRFLALVNITAINRATVQVKPGRSPPSPPRRFDSLGGSMSRSRSILDCAERKQELRNR